MDKKMHEDEDNLQAYCQLEEKLFIDLENEERIQPYAKTKKNLAIVIALSVVLLTVFAGSIAYTIISKTRRGFYDEHNNEIVNPEARRERSQVEMVARNSNREFK